MNNRKNIVNRVLSFVLSAVLVFSGILSDVVPVLAASGSAGTITVAVERFAIGQGYLIEPYITTFNEGDTYETVCRRVLEENGYSYTSSGSSFYLSGIDHADTGTIDIPDCIKKLGQKKIGVSYVDPPDNSAVNEYAGTTNWLGEFSYSEMSGWMYSVGDESGWEFPGVGMDGRNPKDGDVYRLQFTVWGYGEDLTGVKYGDETTVYYEVGDKSALTNKIAQINQNKSDWFAVDGCEKAYNDAVQVLQKLDATQKELDSALSALPEEKPVFPDGVTLQKTEATLNPGDTLQLQATLTPGDVNQSALNWSSSNSNIASVNQNGLVTAQGVGTADITVKTENNKTAVCHVTVEEKEIPITKITLNQTSVSLEVGETAQLKVDSYEPDDATEKPEVTWSVSDDTVASVDADGKVTALKAGSTTITAQTKSGAKATCKVTVTETPVEVYPDGVSLQKTEETLYPEETLQLVATITPGDATHTELSWSSSNSNIASVDPNGLVTARSVGNADITVKTENDKSAVCHITVEDRPITKITLNQTSVSLDIGETTQLNVVSYEPSNATEQLSVSWSSSNEAIASVDADGLVTALTSGSANITARTKGGTEAVCRITVNAEPEAEDIYPDSVTLQKEEETLYPEDTLQLVASITPDYANHTELSWSSNNEGIASVDQDGMVTARQIGTADITVTTENNISAVCHITVEDRPITKIILNQTSVNLEKGESVRLRVESYEPSNATEELEITWTSSDETIASVDSDGTVTAEESGRATITATTRSGVSAACEIIVSESTIDEPSEAAREMEEKISKLPDPGNVTEENAEEILEVWEEYSALDEETKAEISPESVTKLETLKKEAEEILEQQNQGKEEAEAVQKEILEFPEEVTLDNVDDAVGLWKKYLALSDDQRKYLDTEAIDRMDEIVEQVINCIRETVQAVDLDKEFDLESEEIRDFITISNVCDDMDAEQLNEVPEQTLDSIKSIRQWIGDNIHVSENFCVTAEWYVRLIVEDGESSSEIEEAVKDRYSSSKYIVMNQVISYQDIRDGQPYTPKRDLKLETDLTQIENLNDPIVNTASVSDGKVILQELECQYDDDIMSFETSHTGTILILSSPIEITAISVPSEEYVGIGNSISLEVTYIPSNATADKTVTLENSDTSIVKINSDNTLQGIAPGSVTVTVSLKTNPSIQATCRVTVTDKANPLKKSVEQVMKETSEYMLSIDTNPTLGSEWFVLGLARSGKPLDSEYFKTYYNHIANYLEENDGKLTNTVKYTEYSKMILVMTSIGKDARSIAGYNLLENLADMDMITRQGFNGPIWALIALNSNPAYKFPEISGVTEQTTEQKLIDYLLSGEIAGGGWSLIGDEADTDITAMTLQALAPYYNKTGYEKVTAAIDRGVNKLSEMQLSTGGFGTMGAETLESNAQVITALCALGIDPQKDARFIKNGRWTVENLISYHIDNSGFMHVKEGAANNGGAEGGVVNGMATEQGYYALTAYKRFCDGKTSLYDMSDLTTQSGNKGDGTGTGISDPHETQQGGNSGQQTDSSSGGTTDKTGNGTTNTTSNNKIGTTVGKTVKKSTGKLVTLKNDSEEEEKLWSFDGDTYTPAALASADVSDEPITENVEVESDAGEGDTSAVGSVFTGDVVPYVLVFVLGAAIGVVGYFAFLKRKKRI